MLDAISCSGGNSTAAAPSLAPEKATFATSLHASRNQRELQLGARQPVVDKRWRPSEIELLKRAKPIESKSDRIMRTKRSRQIRIFACSVRPSAAPLAILLLALTGCSSQPKTPEPAASVAGLETTDLGAAQQTTALVLPKDFGRFTGDWDQILKRGYLRVLVVYSRSGFFYDKGRQRGAVAEYMEEFENVTNKELKSGVEKFKVVFLPTPPAQLQEALNGGVGDVACAGIIITPEREKIFDFTVPLRNDAKLVVVTSKTAPAIASVDALAGQVVYVNPISVAKAELEKINQSFKQAGKPAIGIKTVDSNLTEEDLLEMVNAGLIPMTVSLNLRAELWSKAFYNIVISPVVIKEDGQIGWAMRKGSPQLKAVMDAFLKTRGQGSTFGNMMSQRFLENTKWIKNSTSEAEMNKFKTYVRYFQQYAAEYNFDYVMLAAQGYQESMLNQELVSPRGAVGVMQVLPKYAAAKPISIPNVRNPRDNIHAGAKMLAQITKTYFNDPGIDQINKTLFTFAAYNAGPNRIVRLRKQAQAQGLDPNQWFGNVELMVAKDIGQETVQYVGNVYKYYVAYKMALELQGIRDQAKQSLKVN
jgi:membrane-bound lytic murein transglycosylase MltF